MFSRKIFVSLALFGFAVMGFADKKTVTGVRITKLEDRLSISIDGHFFTEYHFKDVPRPFCYPVIGPGGVAMTRDWPMKETEGEEHDHPHHRSLWFAHGNVNGVDFWSEQKNFGKQVHEKFLKISDQETGVITSQNKWETAEGKVICHDVRTFRIHRSTNPVILDFEITIKATEGDVTFGDTKEGSMAIRLAETMRLAPNKSNIGKPTGHIAQNTGTRDGETWGKRADWCDYYGPVTGKIVGVAIFDHPENSRHPTWWHVRDYGLFAANPFGQHDFEKLADKSAGNFTIPAGKSATFRYRFIFHEGDEKQAGIEKLYEEYKRPTKSR